MKTKDIQRAIEMLNSVGDFVSSNTDHDDTGIGNEMMDEINWFMHLLKAQQSKIYLKNAMIKLKKRIK